MRLATLVLVCGRTILVATAEVLSDLFYHTEVPPLTPRYNIAPTQPVAVIRQPHRLELLRWGLALAGASAPKINLRAETVAGNPATREIVYSRRCLVIVDGFYEWVRREAREVPMT